MTTWISRNTTPDEGGFILELETGVEPDLAQIRLLLFGIEVARGTALECADRHSIGNIPKPWTKLNRPYDLHDEEVEWICEKLGITRVSGRDVEHLHAFHTD